MPQSSMAQAICDQTTLRCMGRGGGVRKYGIFGALQSHPHPVQLSSGMGLGLGSGWYLAGRASWALTRNLSFILQMLEGSQQRRKWG